MKKVISKVATTFLDLIFPAHCLDCQTIMPRSSPTPYLCSTCLNQIKLNTRFRCPFCSTLNLGGETCSHCKPSHSLDYLWPAGHYDHPLIKKALWAYKYKFVSSLKTALGYLLAKFITQEGKAVFLETHRNQLLVMPVPLHPRRFRWRSYNQSALLAQELCRSFQLTLVANKLQRDRSRRPQTEIPTAERAANARGVFSCRKSKMLEGKTIMLIDDVCTTGSTLDACAKVLKEAGASKVIGLVVAKG